MGPQSRLSKARATGFTIVEILVVLVIVAILLAMAMALTRGVTAAQKRATTVTRIQAIDAAIVQFVMQRKRLPCPADGTIVSGQPNAGSEAGGGAAACTANQANGVVPWVALGIGEADATDGWDRRLTYRAGSVGGTGGGLALNNSMDMSACDPAGTGAISGTVCNAACVSTSLGSCTAPTLFLAGKGLEIRNVTGGIQMNPGLGTGAAYIVISSGESGGGAYYGSGNVGASTTTDGIEEQKNYAALALQAYYLDDGIVDIAGANHFDDMVSRPSVATVISKAALGARSH